MIKICKQCGKDYATYPCRNSKYCSVNCKNEGYKGYKHTPQTCTKMRNNHKGMTDKKMPKWFGKFISKTRQREDNPRWKGGQHKTPYGYMMVLKHGHPHANKGGYVRRSRYIMEQHLGRILKRTEQVHHINHIKDDDRIENLMLFGSCGKHSKFHNKLRRELRT